MRIIVAYISPFQMVDFPIYGVYQGQSTIFQVKTIAFCLICFIVSLNHY